MRSSKRPCIRKSTWIAFSLLALAAVASAQGPTDPTQLETQSEVASTTGEQAVTTSTSTAAYNSGDDHKSEAIWAYNEALSTLVALTNDGPTYEGGYSFASASPNSLFASLFPNLQGQGPFGSLIRISIRLYHQSWLKQLGSILRLSGEGPLPRRKDDEAARKAIKVIDLLQHSVELGHVDALFTLAKISLFPPTDNFPSKPALAFNNFRKYSELTGHAGTQALVAFFYATGYRDIVPVDQAMAQLYYTFAAQGGDKGAQMALAYRYWSGIGTLEDCPLAMEWYEAASEQTMAKFVAGPPGGRSLPQTPTRLSDLSGGAYGPGASVASTGFNLNRAAIKAGLARSVGETWEDVLEYYAFNADRGELDFAFRLGKIFYQGSLYPSPGGIASGAEGVGAVPQSFVSARYYFNIIARTVWPRERDPPNPLSYQPSTPTKEDIQNAGRSAPASAAYLGRMYLRGEGVKQDIGMAKMWFERGAEYGDREAHNGLGIIWRDGLINGRVDMKKAVAHFAAAAGQDLAEAQVNLGKHYFNKRDIVLANTHFENAIYHGSPFEAYYYLGEIQASQAASQASQHSSASAGSCAMAVSFHKIVAERGTWEEDLMKEASTAWNTGTDRGKEMAMLKWWIAAERGHEVAQNNLAFVLDQDKSVLRLTRFSPITPSNDTARLALTQWTRSAAQRNVDALVKVGDYHYHGLGLPQSQSGTNSSGDDRFEIAARYYRSAADTMVSALAMWNLGWMYENGVGVPQDFHLAKRHYDMALETNKEAYLPVVLSLVKLHLKSFWYTLMGGEGGLSLWEDEDSATTREPWEIDGADGSDVDSNIATDGSRDSSAGNSRNRYAEDEPWYLGKAHEEFQRRKNRAQQKIEGWQDQNMNEDDPVQWARNQRAAEADRDGDFGPEDYFEGALRGGNRESEDVAGELEETALLLGLVLLVSVLIYWRTRLRRRQRQAEDARDAELRRLEAELDEVEREMLLAREQIQAAAGGHEVAGQAPAEPPAPIIPAPQPPPAEPFAVIPPPGL